MSSFLQSFKKDLLNKLAEYSAPKFMAQDKRYKKYQIGEFTYGNPEILSWDTSTKLIIGKYCSIAKGVTILLGGNHRKEWLTTYPFPVFFSQLSQIKGHPGTTGNIEIGNDVWICYGATILSGVKIGNGSVIAANANVVDDVPPYSIVAGNPARVKNIDFMLKQLIICRE